MREVLSVPLRENLKHAGLVKNYLPFRISNMYLFTVAETFTKVDLRIQKNRFECDSDDINS